jgi:hypothetical protein
VRDANQKILFSNDLGRNRFYGHEQEPREVVKYVIKTDASITVKHNPAYPGVTVGIETKSGAADYRKGDVEMWMHCPVKGCKHHDPCDEKNHFVGDKAIKGHFASTHMTMCGTGRQTQ